MLPYTLYGEHNAMLAIYGLKAKAFGSCQYTTKTISQMINYYGKLAYVQGDTQLRNQRIESIYKKDGLNRCHLSLCQTTEYNSGMS